MTVRIGFPSAAWANAFLSPSSQPDADYPIELLKSAERPFMRARFSIIGSSVTIDYHTSGAAVGRNGWLLVHTGMFQFSIQSDPASTFNSGVAGAPQYDSTTKTIARHWNGRYGYLLQAGQTLTGRYDRLTIPLQAPIDPAALRYYVGGLVPVMLEALPFDPAWEPELGTDEAVEFVGAGNWDEEIEHDEPAMVLRLPLQASVTVTDPLTSDAARLLVDVQHRIGAGGFVVVSLSDTDPTQAWVMRRRTLQRRMKVGPLSTADYELKEVIGGDHAEYANDWPVDEMSAWGNAILSLSSATQLSLGLGDIPLKLGTGVWIRRAITAAITAGLTNGGLGASTRYYVYAYDVAGVTTGEIALDAPAQDTAHGVWVKTGDATRTLVGMVVTNGSSQFASTDVYRGVRTWFGDNGVTGIGYFTTDRTRATGTIAEINSEIRVAVACWNGETVHLAAAACVASNTAGEGGNSRIDVVAGTLTAMPTTGQAISTETGSASESEANAIAYSRKAGADGLVTITLAGGTTTGAGGGVGTTTWRTTGTVLSMTAAGMRR